MLKVKYNRNLIYSRVQYNTYPYQVTEVSHQ